MLSVLKRHAIQVLVAAGHLHIEVARFVGVDERTVRRVAKEAPVTELSLVASVPTRVGRPSKAEPYRQLVTELVTETPTLLSVEVLRRARLAGYSGGKSALYRIGERQLRRHALPTRGTMISIRVVAAPVKRFPRATARGR